MIVDKGISSAIAARCRTGALRARVFASRHAGVIRASCRAGTICTSLLPVFCPARTCCHRVPGMKVQRVFDFMGCAHRHCICDDGNILVECLHRNLKHRISLCIDRKIFFPVHHHVVIIGAAPFQRCHCFSVLYLHLCRRSDRCPAASPQKFHLHLIRTVLKFPASLFFRKYCLRLLLRYEGLTAAATHSQQPQHKQASCNPFFLHILFLFIL